MTDASDVWLLGNSNDWVFERPAWHARAACRGMGTELFFPERGDHTHEAKRLCRECPVREECFESSFTNNEKFGIWGGLVEQQRRPLRSARNRTLRETA